MLSYPTLHADLFELDRVAVCVHRAHAHAGHGELASWQLYDGGGGWHSLVGRARVGEVQKDGDCRARRDDTDGTHVPGQEELVLSHRRRAPHVAAQAGAD